MQIHTYDADEWKLVFDAWRPRVFPPVYLYLCKCIALPIRLNSSEALQHK